MVLTYQSQDQNLLVVGSPENENTEESPVLEDEDREDFSFEYKYVTPQSEEEIEVQLMANMLLLTAKIFIIKVEQLSKSSTPITVLEKINILSSYGLTFGQLKPVVILKLCIDWNKNELSAEKRYTSPQELPHEPRVDCAIKYLIDRTKFSPVPPQ
jgi:hypothetical protein